MDFSTRSDVEAPIGFVFEQLSDFAGFERVALRRGAEVVRIDGLPSAGPGAQWRTTFAFAGKPRRMVLTLDAFEPQTHLRFDLQSRNVRGELMVDLHELARGQTRMIVKIRIRPLTMAARVALQTIRLAKARAVRRLGERVAGFAREIEGRYLRPGPPA